MPRAPLRPGGKQSAHTGLHTKEWSSCLGSRDTGHGSPLTNWETAEGSRNDEQVYMTECGLHCVHWNLRNVQMHFWFIGIETPVRIFPSKEKAVCVCTCVYACTHTHTHTQMQYSMQGMYLRTYNVSASIILTGWAFKEVFWARFKKVPGIKNGVFPPLVFKSSLYAFSKGQL